MVERNIIMDKAVLVSFNGGKIIIENKCLTSEILIQ